MVYHVNLYLPFIAGYANVKDLEKGGVNPREPLTHSPPGLRCLGFQTRSSQLTKLIYKTA